MVVYAKSNPPEDLRTHTENLLREFETLKGLYGERIERCVPGNFIEYFWDALELTIKYHDLGKLHTPFQNKIRERLKIPLIPTTAQEVPHNLLSPAFLSGEVLKTFPKEIHTVIYQSIAYHHDKDRERELVENPKKWDIIEKIISDDLLPNLDNLSDMKTLVYLPDTLKKFYRKQIEKRFKKKDGDVYNIYVLLKGLLHRIDHAASAHLNVEENLLADPRECVVPYLVNKGVKKESIWQKDILPYRDKNIVMRASTGIGKTEFAYLWLGKNKGFYTLPVRTSVNAMFERTKETFKNEESIGLLHSDSHFYQLEDVLEKQAERSDSNSEGLTKSLHLMDISRQFAMPITISTADQLFTAAFKYRGYEKIYATLSYSKVIIDEIQSYDPEIVAVIIKGLQEVVALGGSFCLMTATLPPLYKEHLVGFPNTEYFERILPDKKHRLKLIDADIIENIKLVIDAAVKYGKVLVIVNTVKKAQQVFEKIKEDSQVKKLNIPIHLLHSAFTYGDRREKEKDILDENCNGIWITTQLVEASLDIDFPVLFTELATIDSLIQRMGRVLRRCKGENAKPFLYKEESPNVYIFESASGIGYVYDKEIVSASLKHLHNFNEKLFGEEDKQSVVEKIFSRENLKDTKYLKKFDASLRLLENGLEADNKRDAQVLFRKISNISVIPIEIKERHNDEIEKALNSLGEKNLKRDEKILALYTLRKYSLSIPLYKVKKKTQLLRGDLFMTTMQYSSSLGLIPDKEIENVL